MGFGIGQDVNEATPGVAGRRLTGKDTEIIGDGRRPKARDPQTNVQEVGELDLGEILGTGFRDEEDLRRTARIDDTMLRVPSVHGRIEPLQIGRVVGVAVDIDVCPTRPDLPEQVVVGALGRLQSCHGWNLHVCESSGSIAVDVLPHFGDDDGPLSNR